LLTGCGAGDLAPTSPLAVAAGQLHGVVHGGIQPVVGAKVYLLEATTTGYGAASKSLLTSATGSTADTIGYSVKSGADGQFTITGDYTCDASAVVYLLALGGNQQQQRFHVDPGHLSQRRPVYLCGDRSRSLHQ
jgi:hypothetical protein